MICSDSSIDFESTLTSGCVHTAEDFPRCSEVDSYLRDIPRCVGGAHARSVRPGRTRDVCKLWEAFRVRRVSSDLGFLPSPATRTQEAGEGTLRRPPRSISSPIFFVALQGSAAGTRA